MGYAALSPTIYQLFLEEALREKAVDRKNAFLQWHRDQILTVNVNVNKVKQFKKMSPICIFSAAKLSNQKPFSDIPPSAHQSEPSCAILQLTSHVQRLAATFRLIKLSDHVTAQSPTLLTNHMEQLAATSRLTKLSDHVAALCSPTSCHLTTHQVE